MVYSTTVYLLSGAYMCFSNIEKEDTPVVEKCPESFSCPVEATVRLIGGKYKLSYGALREQTLWL